MSRQVEQDLVTLLISSSLLFDNCPSNQVFLPFPQLSYKVAYL